jgi:hypothetical protein
MPLLKPAPISFPRSTFPGSTPQESAGRLINCHAEPLGPDAPATQAWHRSPGLSQHAADTGNTGYRGGLIVNNLSFEVWGGNVSTVDAGGVVTSLGNLPGTAMVSIARNQNGAGADVVVVDPGNGAFVVQAAGTPQAPAAYNGAGSLPQPNSVCFQDGYFFFGIADCRVFAGPINALTPFNALTFTTLQSKADAVGQRFIAYAGLLFGFTTSGLEIWQDTAQPAPGFPYSRLVVLPYGLLQGSAIAGFETGVDTLLWVAQDFGVYMLPYGSVTPTKVSPPDLDRLIEAQNTAGNVLAAGCYAFAGKKFWSISSPAWTWEFNLGSGSWNERESLILSGAQVGQQGRWRGVGGHKAFGRWLMGDTQSGKLAFIDDTVITELGAPQLRRLESAPVTNFPNRQRVARADFFFSDGAGNALGATPNLVNPSVAISWSDDNGVTWGNPLVRSLGLQAKGFRNRVSVKNTGMSGPQARRWRLDDTDCAAPFVRATQSDDPKEY